MPRRLQQDGIAICCVLIIYLTGQIFAYNSDFTNIRTRINERIANCPPCLAGCAGLPIKSGPSPTDHNLSTSCSRCRKPLLDDDVDDYRADDADTIEDVPTPPSMEWQHVKVKDWDENDDWKTTLEKKKINISEILSRRVKEITMKEFVLLRKEHPQIAEVLLDRVKEGEFKFVLNRPQRGVKGGRFMQPQGYEVDQYGEDF